jgi:hypothetical protein
MFEKQKDTPPMSPKKTKLPPKENSRIHQTPRTALAAYFESSSIMGKRSRPETGSEIFEVERSIFGQSTASKSTTFKRVPSETFESSASIANYSTGKKVILQH